MTEQDLTYMRMALDLARQAANQDEVPIGAVVVSGGEIVGQGYNLREQGKDATLHAEMIAIREACVNMGGWRLPDSTIYVTLEPCPMCAGAMLNARIGRLVYAAKDKKGGAAGSVVDIPGSPGFNHHIEVEGGVLADEAVALLQEFFRRKR